MVGGSAASSIVTKRYEAKTQKNPIRFSFFPLILNKLKIMRLMSAIYKQFAELQLKKRKNEEKKNNNI